MHLFQDCELCPTNEDTAERFCRDWRAWRLQGLDGLTPPAAWWLTINDWLKNSTNAEDRWNLKRNCNRMYYKNENAREELELTVSAGGDADNLTAVVRARAHDEDDEAAHVGGDMSALTVGSVVTAVILAVASVILAVVVCGGRKQPQEQRSAEVETEPVAEPTLPGSGSDEKGTTLPV